MRCGLVEGYRDELWTGGGLRTWMRNGLVEGYMDEEWTSGGLHG